MKKLNYFLLNMSLRARNERGNLVAAQGEEAQLPDCFVPRNDKVFIVFGQFLRLIYCCIGSVILLSSCGGSSADSGDDKTVSAQTPVTVTSISDSDMVEYTTLNATSKKYLYIRARMWKRDRFYLPLKPRRHKALVIA